MKGITFFSYLKTHKKIVSFGDSFVFGNELKDNEDGSRAWPSLAAQDLGCAYETMSVAGCGNENIARQLYKYFFVKFVWQYA